MALPSVSPEDVAAYAPGAPPVTDEQIDEALDWADAYSALSVLPEPNTRQGRALKRAICAYALFLAAGLKASTVRTTATVAGAKKVKVGSIELERTQVSSEAQAANFAVSAEDWLDRAFQHVVEAGLIVRRAFAGVVR